MIEENIETKDLMEDEVLVEADLETKVIKHSKLGITSFILAFVSGLIVIIGIVISTRAVIGLVDPSMAMDPNSLAPELMGPMMIAGVVMFLGAGLSFLGLILGIIGLFMKNTKKIFAILGTILNGLPIIIVLILMVIGFSMQVI